MHTVHICLRDHFMHLLISIFGMKSIQSAVFMDFINFLPSRVNVAITNIINTFILYIDSRHPSSKEKQLSLWQIAVVKYEGIRS